MTFGYIGYIWAILGCALFSLLLLASAAFLYALSRRGGPSRITHSVEELPVRAAPPADGNGPEAP